ncbi:ABC transporter ATP-binding protein [Fimbriimonas ginsengisoli]|uniref:Lipid A export ATP-binding/permease protein MsbA n=1 Tax=Fimbriimonas ginsengisoli Gsoil 348 TaxID=661478 RepID=A0A068NP57_FIMGI|nr:ABC transporter ATP-binding protein [Fimbriimonas ginsengisoli]AIE85226.1 Lipid A export ATP-binding/permease protein MsbA [Fimbriimonas ginsengisoli Gsoil 348]
MRRSPTTTSTHDEDLKRKVSWASIIRLVGLALPHRKLLTFAGVLALLGTALQLVLPLMIRETVNRVTQSKSVGELDRDALLFLGIILLGSAFGYVQFILSSLAGNRIVMDLRLRLFSHLQRLPVTFFDKTRSGDLTSHLSNDVTQLQATLTDDLVRLAGQLILLFGGIGIAVWMNWRLTVVIVTVLVFVMAFFVTTGRALRKINREALDSLAEAMGSMTEALANIRLVKAFAREPYEDEQARRRLGHTFRLQMRGSKWEAMMATVGAAGFTLMLIGCMWYGARGVLSGTFQVGDVIGFLVMLAFITQPMATLAALYTRLQRATGAADRLFAILDEGAEEVDSVGAVPFPHGPGEVVFNQIEFQYVADTPVLTGLSLVAPAGKVTAIVGPSGAGKTTLASLVYRFYEPQSGEILIDGVPIRNMQRGSVREHIGIVPQEPILFNGTLRENIRYGRLDATDAEVEAAARSANVEEFVLGFPTGYETMIGERGITLSGGQRQRVAIARALLKDPKILILDEATSALDTKSESLVREALDRLMDGRTTLVIAHRLSTVVNADQIAVVADGRVAEMGTHEELLRQGGRYAELYEFVGA